MPRPEPREPAPEGYHWEVAESEHWRLVDGKRCRAGAGFRKPACGAPSVAEFNRSAWSSTKPPNWWAYCGEHLFLNWIEAGRVVHWRLVEDSEASRG